MWYAIAALAGLFAGGVLSYLFAARVIAKYNRIVDKAKI